MTQSILRVTQPLAQKRQEYDGKGFWGKGRAAYWWDRGFIRIASDPYRMTRKVYYRQGKGFILDSTDASFVGMTSRELILAGERLITEPAVIEKKKAGHDRPAFWNIGYFLNASLRGGGIFLIPIP